MSTSAPNRATLARLYFLRVETLRIWSRQPEGKPRPEAGPASQSSQHTIPKALQINRAVSQTSSPPLPATASGPEPSARLWADGREVIGTQWTEVQAQLGRYPLAWERLGKAKICLMAQEAGTQETSSRALQAHPLPGLFPLPRAAYGLGRQGGPLFPPSS